MSHGRWGTCPQSRSKPTDMISRSILPIPNPKDLSIPARWREAIRVRVSRARRQSGSGVWLFASKDTFEQTSRIGVRQNCVLRRTLSARKGAVASRVREKIPTIWRASRRLLDKTGASHRQEGSQNEGVGSILDGSIRKPTETVQYLHR